MLVTIFCTLVVIWMILMVILCSPQNFYRDLWDRLRKGAGQRDRIQLQMMLDNLRTNPDRWSITREAVSFPKDGAKRVYLNYDGKKWDYTLDGFSARSKPLVGHFAREFDEEITLQNNKRESTALLRTFYPDLDGPLMLGNR